MDKLVLVIDDNDQSNVIRDLEREAKKKGINLICHQFNVGSPAESALLTRGMIDIEKVKAAYKERFKDKGLVFNLILCDWDLSDDEIDGAELLRRICNECFSYKTPRILYSSLLKEMLEKQLDKYDKELDETKTPVINYISSLINGNYLAFLGREDLKGPTLSYLRDSESLDFLLEDVLRRYPNEIMAVGHGHNLEGRSFSEVAQLIQTNDEVAYDFKRDIIQEVTLYLTKEQRKYLDD